MTHVSQLIQDFMQKLHAHIEATEAERAAAAPDIHAAEAACRAHHAAEQEASIVRHLGACGVREDLLEPFREGLRDTPAVATVKRWLETEKTFCLLTGGTGSGKSVAASYALRLATKVSRTHPHPLSDGVDLVSWDRAAGLFVLAGRLVTSSRFEEGRELSLMDKASTVRILVLDELRAEDCDGAGRKRLEEVLGERYATRRRTIVTTNLKAAQVRDALGERIASRFAESAIVFDAGNTDMRRTA